MEKNRWICENEETVIDSPFMRLVRQDCRSSEDKDQRHRFYIMRSRDWCNIIPITEEGNIVLVRQFRIGAGVHTLEIPGGVVDPEDEDASRAALREMIEETGYEPLPSAKTRKLGQSLANPAIQNNFVHSFIVGPVRKTRKQTLDPGELIETLEVPPASIPLMIRNGELSHALILNAFFYLALENEAARDLIAGLKLPQE